MISTILSLILLSLYFCRLLIRAIFCLSSSVKKLRSCRVFKNLFLFCFFKQDYSSSRVLNFLFIDYRSSLISFSLDWYIRLSRASGLQMFSSWGPIFTFPSAICTKTLSCMEESYFIGNWSELSFCKDRLVDAWRFIIINFKTIKFI